MRICLILPFLLLDLLLGLFFEDLRQCFFMPVCNFKGERKTTGGAGLSIPPVWFTVGRCFCFSSVLLVCFVCLVALPLPLGS